MSSNDRRSPQRIQSDVTCINSNGTPRTSLVHLPSQVLPITPTFSSTVLHQPIRLDDTLCLRVIIRSHNVRYHTFYRRFGLPRYAATLWQNDFKDTCIDTVIIVKPTSALIPFNVASPAAVAARNVSSSSKKNATGTSLNPTGGMKNASESATSFNPATSISQMQSPGDVAGAPVVHPLRAGSKMPTNIPLPTQEGKQGVVQYAL